MKDRILAKLKDSRTNWKYILAVLILAFAAGLRIFWFQSELAKEITSIIQFSEIEKRREKENKIPEDKIPFPKEVFTSPEFQKYFQKLVEANAGLKAKDFTIHFTTGDLPYKISLTPLHELPSEIKITPFPSPSEATSNFWKFSPNKTKAIAMHHSYYRTQDVEEEDEILLLYTSSTNAVELLEDWRPFEGLELENFAVFWLNDDQFIHIFQRIAYYEVLGGEKAEEPLGANLEIDLIDLKEGVISWFAISERVGGTFNNPWRK